MNTENNKIHTLKHLKEYRSELRNNLTPAEAFLWKHLKSRQFENRRFTRQHSIGNFIVDFYCRFLLCKGKINNRIRWRNS